MRSCESKEFIELKAEIEAHKRLCGYYIIKLIDVTELRESGRVQEEIAEKAFRYFDDHEWVPREMRADDRSWADYSVEREAAKRHAVEALVGGSPIGHIRETISPRLAEQYFDRFEALFDAPTMFYIGMGFGDQKHVFLHGVAAISPSRAGVLWIAEDD